MPGVAREPTEEEILNDVEKLGFDGSTYNLGLGHEFRQDGDKRYVADWAEKRAEAPPTFSEGDATEFEYANPAESKRYHEFIGKRNNIQANVQNAKKELYKNWLVRRHNGDMGLPPHRNEKRYLEFLGKRAMPQFPTVKRYVEFLG